MPPQGRSDAAAVSAASNAKPTAQPSRSRGGRSKAAKTLSQKELSVVVMLLAAETAVVTTTAPPLPAGSEAGAQQIVVPQLTPQSSPLAVRLHSLAPRLDASTVAAAQAAFVADGADGLNAAMRKTVCSFLPWRECAALRQVSKSWRAASHETVVVTTLPSRRDVPALFLPCPYDVDRDVTTEDRLRCKHAGKWRCQFCGFCNTETRILCGNRHCQVPCATHRECARLFLGQLRREGTVPFLKWLVEGVMGSDAAPTHIVNAENHRQLATGRGKGCAWIYLADQQMAPTVLRYHHRVFADVDPTTHREGVWIVPPGSESALAEDVSRRATYDNHRCLLLPRGALVVEFPSRQPYPLMMANGSPDMMGAPAPHPAHHAGASASLPPPSYQATLAVPPSPVDGEAPAAPAKDGSVTPPDGLGCWLPSTDSPPSELSEGEKQSPSSVPSPNATGAPRRHEPYRTSPVVAGSPAAMSSSSGTPLPYHSLGPAAMDAPYSSAPQPWQHYRGAYGGNPRQGGRRGGRRHHQQPMYDAYSMDYVQPTGDAYGWGPGSSSFDGSYYGYSGVAHTADGYVLTAGPNAAEVMGEGGYPEQQQQGAYAPYPAQFEEQQQQMAQAPPAAMA